MANDLAARPLKIDTAMADTTGVPARMLKCVKVYWFNPSAAADVFTLIEHTSGKVLLQGRAEAANQSQMFDFSGDPLILPAGNWRVSALTAGGILYIYA